MDDGELATAGSQMLQVPPSFNEASRTVKAFVFLAASLLKVKRLQASPGKLVARSEADDDDSCKAECGDLCAADGGEKAKACS